MDGEQLVSVGGGNYQLWTPDGRELVYLRGDSELMAIIIESQAPLRVGPAERLFNAAPYEGLQDYRQWDLSHDGQAFLMLKADTSATADSAQPQLVLVQHWFEELKRLVPVD